MLGQVLVKHRFLFAGVALGAVIVVVLFLWALSAFDDPPHLPDAELISRFQKHRADFEQLRNMMIHDKGLFRVNYERTLPEDPQSIGITSSRIAEYRTLLKRLDMRGGIAASEDKKTIELTASFRGWVTHNSQKGYVYETERVSTYLSPDLDQFLKSEVGIGLRPLEGNWYLFFQGY